MEQPELKDNLCTVKFMCNEFKDHNECVHHKNKKRCKFFNDYDCKNSVAHIQAISRHLKHIGLDITWKNQVKDVQIEKAKEEFVKNIKIIYNLEEKFGVDYSEFAIEQFAEFCSKIGV